MLVNRRYYAHVLVTMPAKAIAKRGRLRECPRRRTADYQDRAMSPTFSQSRPTLRSLLAALAALLLLPAISGCSKNSSKEEAASGTGPVIARVNGTDIRESDLALAE